MQNTYQQETNLKSLEDLSLYLTTALLSLATLQNAQVRAIKLGIMPEDMNERANTIIWDIRRLMNLYKQQLEETLELLPPEFNPQAIIETLKKKEITKARALIRSPKKEKTNDSEDQGL